MAQINVNNLTFAYEGSLDNVFENTSFTVDTNWRLGFIGRNGKGKNTFLNLLMGKYEYNGSISTTTVFDYFPYVTLPGDMAKPAYELMENWKPGLEDWKVMYELPKLAVDAELLYRPFNTLSFGERTKIMLAVLFSGENDFLLVDEPTNHLDKEAREIVKNYLKTKKGFILVSHDRDVLDACIDHVLVLNRASIEIQAGNFSSWWENKEKADINARAENEKHIKEIGKLEAAADRASRWAEKNENTKIGFDPIKEHDRFLDTRCFIGAKTKKMQKRVKAYEGTKMLFICYPKCSTCQKAKKWLDEHNIKYTECHIVDANPTYDELKEWYGKSGLPLKKFFNTSGLIYKEMQLKDKIPAMSEEEQLQLLATNGMLVKRPLVVDGNTVLVGFKEAEWSARLS